MNKLMTIMFSICLYGVVSVAHARTIEVPVSFSTEFLTRLLGEIVFKRQSELSVWGDQAGCNDLTLSNSVVIVEQGNFFIISDAQAQTGFLIAGRCIRLLRWQGKVKALQRADVMHPAGRIAFSTVDTELLTTENRRATISNRIWDLAKDNVFPHYDRLSIDLTTAVEELRQLVPYFLDIKNETLTQELKDSFHLDELRVKQDGLAAIIKFDLMVQENAIKLPSQESLDDEEIAQFVELWQQWDAFLGFIVKVAARNTVDHRFRDQMLDTLIETRYALVEVLASDSISDAMSVRNSFINAWHQLAPVLRGITLEARGVESLRLLGFIAAGDAIDALDQLGPVTGWDVSVDGLRRMARLLIDDTSEDPLDTGPEVDRELRELFEFGPALELPPIQTPATNNNEQSFLNWLFVPAQADSDEPDLNQMLPNRNNLDHYLGKVLGLLDAVSDTTLTSKSLSNEYRKLYQDLVLATAWQETCWRQYHERGGKIVPLTSSAGALGLMQIMPVVWRGFYDRDSLGNNIEYNAAAGSEILLRYLVRYAIRKGEHLEKGGISNLARATYAAYNGGPRHLKRYRQKDTSDSLKEIDHSFWDKYNQIRQGDRLSVRQCYPYG